MSIIYNNWNILINCNINNYAIKNIASINKEIYFLKNNKFNFY